jgi:hypothetical protein
MCLSIGLLLRSRSTIRNGTHSRIGIAAIFGKFFELLRSQKVSVERIQAQFEKIAAMSILSGATKMRQMHQKLIPHRHTAFELYGIDVLIDESFHCWLLEVNVSPSLSGEDCEFDRFQKSEIISELFALSKVVTCDPAVGCLPIERYNQVWRESIVGQAQKQEPWDWENPVFADMVGVRDFIEEKKTAMRFKRIFPRRKTVDSLVPCIEKLGYCNSSLLAWIRKDNDGRLAALVRGREAYERGLARVNDGREVADR